MKLFDNFMEKRLQTHFLPHVFAFSVILYIVVTLVVYYSVQRPQNSPTFPSFLGSLVNWEVQAAGTIIMAVSCFAFLCIGQLVGHSMFYLKNEFAVPINIITDICVILFFVDLYVPRNEYNTPNGILFIIAYICIFLIQGILYYCEKKPMLEQNCHSYQQTALLVLNFVLFVMWLVFWLVSSPSYSKYVVAGVSYGIAIFMCFLVYHLSVEISDVEVKLVYDLPPELPY